MKAINSNNRSAKKQINIMLVMFLFLFSASIISTGSLFAGNKPSDLNNPVNKLSAAELMTSPALTVENNMVFSFNMPCGEYVKFSVYNTKGEEIAVLINEKAVTGEIKADLSLAFLKNGIYYYSLEAGNYREVRKLNVFEY